MSAPNKVPHAHIDVATRAVQITQPHPILVDSPQSVLLSFAMLKSLVAQILQFEAQAEAATGDPRSIPQKPENGTGIKR